MIQLHYRFLFNNKTKMIPLGIILVFTIVILANANLLEPYKYIEADYQTNYRLYIFDSITTFMLIDVIVIDLIVTHAFIINWYDIQLIARKSRMCIITSKIFVLIAFSLWVVMVMILVVGITGEIRGYNMIRFIGVFSITGVLFHCYYLFVTMFFALTYQTVWHTMIPVFGFIISFIFSADGGVEEQNALYKLLQVFFPTITYKDEILPVFLYGDVIVFSAILIFFSLIIKRYQTINLS